jgi:phosphatidylserine decarboxylase
VQPVIAREGWPHTALTFTAALAVTLWAGWLWSLPLWLVFLFVAQFFRDPRRSPPREAGVIVSPADGRVVFVGPANDPYLERSALKISVFMNVFSVHSNRSPATGEVKKIWYTTGRFINAALDKASDQNERNAIWMRHGDEDIVFVQVAGLIARRILCYVNEGDHLERGQRYGFIRFGSRVDLYLPETCTAGVALGDKATAGLTVVARES